MGPGADAGTRDDGGQRQCPWGQAPLACGTRRRPQQSPGGGAGTVPIPTQTHGGLERQKDVPHAAEELSVREEPGSRGGAAQTLGGQRSISETLSPE